MIRIDMDAASKIRAILTLSRSKGVDPVPVLDRARMLRHMGTRREDAVRVLDHVIDVVNTLNADHTVKTPLDMRHMIIEKLREIQNDITG